MRIEKTFVRNFLSSRHNNWGVLAGASFLTICFIMSLFYWDKSYPISSFLSASRDTIFVNGEYWRLFTTSFIHGDLQHLLANSLMLYILTYFVTSFYGGLQSLIVSSIMGVAINLFVLYQYQTNTTLVGASGIVYYLWGFWLTLYFFIQTHQTVLGRILRIGAVFFILLIPTQYSPSTSYLAHYFGFLIGLGVGCLYYLLKRKKLHSFEIWKFKVIQDDDLDFDWKESTSIKPSL